MEKQHPIGDLMTTTMQKLREIADVNTIVGKPILAGEITIIPISKLTVGFASGGSDFTSKNQKPEDDNSFGGGNEPVPGGLPDCQGGLGAPDARSASARHRRGPGGRDGARCD